MADTAQIVWLRDAGHPHDAREDYDEGEREADEHAGAAKPLCHRVGGRGDAEALERHGAVTISGGSLRAVCRHLRPIGLAQGSGRTPQ